MPRPGAPSRSTFYVAAHKDDVSELGPDSVLLLHRYSSTSRTGPTPHIGLRADGKAAWRCAKRLIEYEPGMEADYRLVCLTLSAEAVAHFVVTSAGQEYRYAPLLQKQTWWNATTKDWHWWRFHGDFPLMRRGVEFNVLEIDAEGSEREPPPRQLGKSVRLWCGAF